MLFFNFLSLVLLQLAPLPPLLLLFRLLSPSVLVASVLFSWNEASVEIEV